jgi:putative endopeptidase
LRLTLSSIVRTFAVVAVAAFVIHSGGLQAAAQGVTSGIDLSWFDRTCKPCDDFYQFADGGWIKAHPVPAALPSYGSFYQLYESNRDVLQKILEKAAASNAPAGSDEQKIGNFYASCLDVAAIDKAGATPIQPMLAQIDGVTDAATLAPVLAALQINGVSAFFGMGSGADFKDSTQSITQVDQDGLGLPDRDYYLKTDAKSQATRDAYVAHVTKMFVLLGESQAQAATDAASVMTIETALAKSSLSRVQRRDPSAIYHKMDLPALESLAKNVDWGAYFTASGVTPGAINVSEPDYFTALSTALPAWTPAQIKAYLRWHTIHKYATSLSTPFVDENFAFYSTTLQGTTKQLERPKRCAVATDAALGEALGKLYVAQVFPPAAKAQALEMVKYVKETLRSDFQSLDWMSPQTKALAVAKLDAFDLKIGYPDKWRDYSSVTIVPGPYADNVIATNAFENKRDYAKIGKPIDRTEWGMTPPTVNAYYNPTVNEIVFPAGILQPPFFDANADMAVNFGGIGAVIGHESTHGFDDSGRQFDAHGNLADWWTPADATKFNAKAQCIVDQFNTLSPLPGVMENGKLVQGEEIADLGGVTIAYKAFERWQATHPRLTLDGFTPEQRFFIGWARVWASNARPEYTRMLAGIDVHAYDKFRVNATLSNMPAFAKAWGCKIGDAMVRPVDKRCAIW